MVKKILLVFPQGIGDFLYPLDQILLRLENSKDKFHFDLIVQYEQIGDLLKNFIKNNTCNIFYTSKKYYKNSYIFYKLFKNKYDYLVIDPNLNTKKSIFFSIFINSKYKIYKKIKFGDFLFSHQIGEKYLHKTKDRFKQMVEIANILEGEKITNKNFKFNIQNFLINNNKKNKKNILGIIPGSGDLEKIKRWPSEHYIKFLQFENIKNTFQEVFLFGSPSETNLLEKIKDGVKEDYKVSLFNKNIIESLNNLTKCSFFLSNDNGLLHYVRSLKLNHILIYGPTYYPELYLPLEEKNILRTGISCSPCIYRLGRKGCGDEKCLKLLYPETVLNKFKKNFEEQI